MRNVIVSLLAKFRTPSPVRRGFVVALAILVGLVVFARMSPTPMKKEAQPNASIENAESWPSELQMEAGRARDELKEYAKMSPAPLDARDISGSRMGGMTVPGDPLIAHTAELAVATKEFAKSPA